MTIIEMADVVAQAKDEIARLREQNSELLGALIRIQEWASNIIAAWEEASSLERADGLIQEVHAIIKGAM